MLCLVPRAFKVGGKGAWILLCTSGPQYWKIRTLRMYLNTLQPLTHSNNLLQDQAKVQSIMAGTKLARTR